MSHLVTLHAKSEIEAFARRNPFHHLYELGDLDDDHWPHTTWYGWQEGGTLRQLALVYTAISPPIMLAYADPPRAQMADLLRAILPYLPCNLFTHVSVEAASVLTDAFRADSHGLHWKMAFTDPAPVEVVDMTGVVRMTEADEDALKRLYEEAYPGNAYNGRMLQSGWYYGLREDGEVVSVAGVHVCSTDYRVAMIGDVTTHPTYRGRGLSKKVCAALCRALVDAGIRHIGLNVKHDNEAALALYLHLGFEKIGEYEGLTLHAKDAVHDHQISNHPALS